jgi:hypothetical protein
VYLELNMNSVGEKIRLLAGLVFCIGIVGCSTMTSLKRTEYSAEKRLTNKPASTIFLCRPSSFFMGITSFGVTINQSAIGDLGSGEVMSITLPKPPSIYLSMLIPNQNPLVQLLAKPKEFGLRLNADEPINYVVFTVKSEDGPNDGISGAGSPFIKGSGPYEITGTFGMKLQAVSQQTFKKMCPTSEIQYFTHNQL